MVALRCTNIDCEGLIMSSQPVMAKDLEETIDTIFTEGLDTTCPDCGKNDYRIVIVHGVTHEEETSTPEHISNLIEEEEFQRDNYRKDLPTLKEIF